MRSAVELRILRLPAEHCGLIGAARLEMAISDQEKVVGRKNAAAFGALDYAFRKSHRDIAQAGFAYDAIMTERSELDRLRLPNPTKKDVRPELVADHRANADAVKDRDAHEAVAAWMKCLSRLDETIAHVFERNADHFDPA